MAGIAGQRLGVALQPPHFVAGDDAELAAPLAAFPHQPPERGAQELPVAGMDGLDERLVSGRGRRALHAEERKGLVGDGERAPRGVPFPAPDVGEALRLREERLAPRQLRLRPPPLDELPLQLPGALLDPPLQARPRLAQLGVALLDAGQHVV